MKRFTILVFVLLFGWALGASPALAQQGAVAQRAVDGAKQYVKKHNMKNPTQKMLLNSLFRNAMPDFVKMWKELTGVQVISEPLGYTDIPSKIMGEAVAKTGAFDIFNDFPYTQPDAAGAGVLKSLDEYAAKGKPDFSGIPSAFLGQQKYNGKLYSMVLDGDHIMLVLRKDIVENPKAMAEYKAKYGKNPGCPATMAEWEQMASFFHTKAGQTRWGIKFEKPLYGAMAYRSVNFSHRHFPSYFGGLLFDKDMNPRINTAQGIKAIKAFSSIVKYMPEDVQGWGTPQIYPFWGSGQAFSVMSFPSIFGYANANPKSKVKGKQVPCIIPATTAPGKPVRRASEAAGTGYMINAYGKHPELAYYFVQWMTSPSIGNQAIAHRKGFWDPYRTANLNVPGILAKFGPEFLKTTMENAQYTTSLLFIDGHYEYMKILDNNLANVMNRNITAEAAAKKIEAGWNRVTKDIGRKEQITVWRKGVNDGLYIDKF
ncbi:MAG: extracellular solute-binding protein [Rhodospirillales bacterium]|jgi:multiple sugar transport system substrate-binding protein|nr:extracellular solute-binding protein [Rhodospirillales bacterium]|tara:strand:+ start:253 stop:1707 length:1455 start_codon:yes stop_codon:yes gene_type:complete